MEDVFVYFKAYIRNNFRDSIWIVFFAVFLFVIVSIIMQKQKKKQTSSAILRNVSGILLSLECSFIFVMTLFRREYVKGQVFNFKLFVAYAEVFKENDPELILQVILNIIMFIPFGLLLPCCFEIFKKYKYVLLITLASSICIELIQGIFKIGYFELVDITNNIIGATIGKLIYTMFVKIRGNIESKKVLESKK